MSPTPATRRGSKGVDPETPSTVVRRIAALFSLLLFVVAIAVVVIFVVRHLGAVLLSVAALGICVGGGWWIITESGLRRVFGAVTAGFGIGLLAVSLLLVVDGVDRLGLRLLVLVVTLLLALGLARFALLPEIHEAEAARVHRVAEPRRPVLLCNPWSGGGKVETFDLVPLAEELGVQPILLAEGLDLEQLARQAVADGADCLGMAGGDGSQALVASIAIEHDLPFVCISAGTRNHFALDLGLDREDPRTGMAAFRSGIERRIDYATVNGRLFVNNVSLGVYAAIVQEDSYRESKVETTTQLLPDLLGSTSEPFDLQFDLPDGSEIDGAFLVQVSNNPYVFGSLVDAGQRRRLDTGNLGIVAVSTPNGAEAAKLVTMAVAGLAQRHDHFNQWEAPRFTVRSRSGTAYAGVDGEALEMETPLEFVLHHRGLRLLVPEENIRAASLRRAREVSVRQVVDLVLGRSVLNPGT